MRTIIFGSTKARAFRKMDKVIETLDQSNIQKIMKHGTQYTVDMFDGTRYMAVVLSDNIRGMKCNYAIVDIEIDAEIVDKIIRPLILFNYAESKGSTTQEYEYFR